MENREFENLLESLEAPEAVSTAHQRRLRVALLDSAIFRQRNFMFSFPKLAMAFAALVLIVGGAVYGNRYSSVAQAKQILNQSMQKVNSLTPEQLTAEQVKINADLAEALRETQNGKNLKYLGEQDVSGVSGLAQYGRIKLLRYVNSQGQTVVLGISRDSLPVFKKVLSPGERLQNVFASVDDTFEQANLYNKYLNADLGLEITYPVQYGDFTFQTKMASAGSLCSLAAGYSYEGSFTSSNIAIWGVSSDYAPCASNPPLFNVADVETDLNKDTVTLANYAGQKTEYPISGGVRDSERVYYSLIENYTYPESGRQLPFGVVRAHNGKIRFLAYYLKDENIALDKTGGRESSYYTIYRELGQLMEYTGVTNAELNPPAPGKETDNDTVLYQNSTYGVSFRYPKSFIQFGREDGKYYAGTYLANSAEAKFLAGVAMPNGSYRNTNFSSGVAYVFVSDKMAQSTCQTYGNDSQPMSGSATYNGISYSFAESSGAAAGTFVTDRIYHTFRNGKCYEVVLSLWETNLGNYEPNSRIRQFDRNEVWGRLEAVLRTMKIENQPAPAANASVQAEFGKPVTLRKGETAAFRGSDVTLTVWGFANSPCPEGVRCVWNGLNVNYELNIGGTIYRNADPNDPGNPSPYVVGLQETDYKTYATFIVTQR